MSYSGNTTSQRAQSTEGNAPPPPSNTKYSIFIDADGAKGKDAAKWSSRCGVLIRIHIPIGYEEWRKVDKFYKDNLWNALVKEFKMNIDPNLARPILEDKFPQYFRTVKSIIRKKYLKRDGELIPKRVALDNRPEDVDKVWWDKFIDIEYSDKKIKQCKTNAENKRKSILHHTLGRKSYRKLYDDLETENPGEKITRAMAWKAAHKKTTTGDVPPCAAEKFALIVAAEERQKSEASVTGGDGIKGLEEFENDPIAEVFGDEKGRSYCRAISSTANVKRVKLTQASKAIVNFKENEDKQWKTEMQNNQNQVNETIKSMSSAIVSMEQTMQQFLSRIGGNITPRAECDSHAERASNDNVTSLEIGIESSTRAKQLVSLLLRDEVEVGRGHLETRGICHGRKVLRGEKVVWVHEVLDPESPIFEAPQDGNYKLPDIADGGFMIWPEYRIRHLNGNKEN